jgi:hypothetical protein
MERRVRFIRKNGRVIPIVEKEKSERRKGLALIGSAVAVGGAGGYIAGGKIRRAERMQQMTFDFLNDKPHSKLPKGAADVFEGMAKARKRLEVGKRFARASRWISTGLVFAGLHKVLKNDDDSEAMAVYAGFRKRSPFAGPFSSEAKKVSLDLFKKFVKKKVL